MVCLGAPCGDAFGKPNESGRGVQSWPKEVGFPYANPTHASEAGCMQLVRPPQASLGTSLSPRIPGQAHSAVILACLFLSKYNLIPNVWEYFILDSRQYYIED